MLAIDVFFRREYERTKEEGRMKAVLMLIQVDFLFASGIFFPEEK